MGIPPDQRYFAMTSSDALCTIMSSIFEVNVILNRGAIILIAPKALFVQLPNHTRGLDLRVSRISLSILSRLFEPGNEEGRSGGGRSKFNQSGTSPSFGGKLGQK